MLSLSYISMYFVVSITAALLTAALIFTSGMRRGRPEFLSLAVLCLVIVSYQFFTWKYHQANTIDTAVYWLRLQTSSIIATLPFYFFTFAKWSRFKFVSTGTYLCFGLVAGLIVANHLYEYSLRFSTIFELDKILTFTNEYIYILRGEGTRLGLFTYALVILMMLVLMLAMRRFYQRGNKPVAILLGSAICIHLSTLYLSILIDNGEINFVYMGALPVLYLNIGLCFFGAYTLRSNTEQISTLSQQNQDLENAIAKLAEGFNTTKSSDFYEKMLLNLHSLTGIDYIFIGRLEEVNKAHIKTKVMLKLGKVSENITYALKDTPCEKVLNEDACVYSDGVIERFPDDKLLADMHIKSYIGKPLFDDNGQILGILTLLHTAPLNPTQQLLDALQIFSSRAASELQRDSALEQLRTLAYTDYTTTLANKARLFEVLNETLLSCELHKKNAIFMLIDIDKFTNVNRELGYDIGESILRELGQRLLHLQHNNVFFARTGGDEFAAIFYDAGAQPAGYLDVQWEAIRAILRKPIEVGEKRVRIDYSMGAVVFPEQTGRKYDIMQCAESALSQSKLKGRGHGSIFEPRLLEILEYESFIESELRKALNQNNQLRMAYQPKTNLAGELLGVEALIRWQHPQKGNIPPDEFISIAEQSELIIDLGDWVINQICEQIKQWDEQGFTCKVAINLSASQLLKMNFKDYLIEQLSASSISPTRIELEITESTLLSDIDAAVKVLKQLRMEGFSIALDDFGTGYSSLSYLRELPLDVLKIDKLFIDKMEHENRIELVKTIISIGKHLALDIVAEGVEYKEQVLLLSEIGCNTFQGYYFSRPLDGNDIPSWQFRPTSSLNKSNNI